MGRGRRSSNDPTLNFVVYVLLGLFLMPIVGLVFACGKDPSKKTLGCVLLIVGVILWILIAVASAN